MCCRLPGQCVSAVQSSRGYRLFCGAVCVLPRVFRLRRGMRRMYRGGRVCTMLHWVHGRGKHRGTAAAAIYHQ